MMFILSWLGFEKRYKQANVIEGYWMVIICVPGLPCCVESVILRTLLVGFACVWWILALTHGDLLPENAQNPSFIPCVTGVHSFADSFLFSIETQHTIGYGSRSITTECPNAILLMCTQCIFGCLVQACMTGLMFAKMARPKQRSQTLLFSKTCVINLRDGQLCLMFRVGDMREKSHLIGAAIRGYLLKQRTTKEGEILSPFLSELKLHIDNYVSDVLLLWPVVVVHTIDKDSPLYDMSAQTLLHEKFEIIVTLEGTTESTGLITQAKTSYLPSEVLWGHRYEPICCYNREKFAYQVEYSLFHNTHQVDTPLCSAHELDNSTT